MKTDEQWKPITGFEDYEISSLGRVKSLKFGKEKILKPGKDGWGYLFVYLCRNGKRKMFKVHRLVASAFLPNPMGLPEVNHKDENPSNNVKSNIEWCSRRYNMRYGTLQERSASARSKAVEASNYEDFREICLRFPSTAEAGRNGYKSQNVSACCRGCFNREGNNKYKNLYWRFAS